MMNNNLFAKLENKNGYEKTNVANILNPYVNFNGHKNTQSLADTLVAESIQMRGVECYYIPREYVKPDQLFGEDLQNKFTKAWMFAAYVNSFEGYEGANSFFSKFGMQVSDEITLSINPGLFKHQTNGTEPKEGDLIYFKMDNSLFEINWVEPYDPFYQVGTNSIRKITAGKFIYSGEELNPELQKNTGIEIPEFSELDLSPVKNLDGLADIGEIQYEEVDQINKEASEFVKEYVVINGRGINDPQNASPFDDGFMS
ncbi:neck protein [Salmonella phage Melville]|uniref:Neck protein n=1 Tax=Salmonella phage Melville TaxID=2041413 RepID=A0A2D1GM72_9CAUD|nr:head closure Hc2 [Salmonella phage Melville]ATN93127.1 neck protein [Salmonella phage Melville]